jgi:putative ATPase
MSEPLAYRMRPQTLDEFVGQRHLLAQGAILKQAVSGKPTSLILWGPPGSGKTTLAHLIASAVQRPVVHINAVTTGVPQLKKTLSEGLINPLLFVDEIHRWNKSQQDFLLPYVESGKVLLIGSTTENPYYEVIGPLLSRVRVLKLDSLDDEDIAKIIKRALSDTKGLGDLSIELPDEVLAFIVAYAGGDARSALNLLEDLVNVSNKVDGKATLQIPSEEVLKRLPYDKTGDEHYQVISAFIKSLRGSDIDAAVYWLSRMVESGEDPKFIARRMVILAAEDVGLADPWALMIANAGFQAVTEIGMPEAGLVLSEVAVYMAQAPKSNRTSVALWEASAKVRESTPPVPLHLRNASFKGAKQMGYGVGYKYPHEFKAGFTAQQYLPDELKDVKFYEPSEIGFEQRIKERMEGRKQIKEEKEE